PCCVLRPPCVAAGGKELERGVVTVLLGEECPDPRLARRVQGAEQPGLRGRAVGDVEPGGLVVLLTGARRGGIAAQSQQSLRSADDRVVAAAEIERPCRGGRVELVVERG